jgi:hypothetical protein
MKLVAGHQPNLYPYGGFFSKMAKVDEFVIVDNTQYVKKQYHNRNRIKLLNGDTVWLSIPVKNSGRYKQLINEVEIDNAQDWRQKHKNTLLRNYKKSPFFDKYYPGFEELLSKEWIRLFDFNFEFIKLSAEYIGIETPLLVASEIGAQGKASGLILDICRKTGGDAYLHGKHANDYVDFDLLKDAGIENYLQNFESEQYFQHGKNFVPNLSVLDILFNCGEETLVVLDDSTEISAR